MPEYIKLWWLTDELGFNVVKLSELSCSLMPRQEFLRLNSSGRVDSFVNLGSFSSLGLSVKRVDYYKYLFHFEWSNEVVYVENSAVITKDVYVNGKRLGINWMQNLMELCWLCKAGRVFYAVFFVGSFVVLRMEPGLGVFTVVGGSTDLKQYFRLGLQSYVKHSFWKIADYFMYSM